MKKITFLFCFLMLVCSSFIVNAQSAYQITNKIKLGGAGGWDYLSVDNAAGRLYVSHATQVMVVDLQKGALAGSIPDTKGVHGIAIARDLNKGFISCGRDSSVAVFDLKTLAVTARVKVTGRNPDAILYDPFKHLVLTFNGGSSNSTVLDAKTDKVIGTIQLAGKPEFAQTDGKGKVYVNIEDKSSLTVINTNTLKVENDWSIAPGEEASGLAFDVANHRLFMVCSNKLMVVMNALNGKVITTLPIGNGCDGVAFDPGLKRAYSSNGDGTMTVVQEENPEAFKVLENVPTQSGARTIACDISTHALYLPSAEYEPRAAGATGRPQPKPDSFMVLEIKPIK
ncbi:MAG: YncE family protein [Bacteroidota bacterium]|nr:YncE family protein [Bacteroidota bacterium]